MKAGIFAFTFFHIISHFTQGFGGFHATWNIDFHANSITARDNVRQFDGFLSCLAPLKNPNKRFRDIGHDGIAAR